MRKVQNGSVKIAGNGGNKMELKEIQRQGKQMREKRGFTMEPDHIFMMLAEEVGEVAGELKRVWSKNYEKFAVEDLEDELADVMVLLLALANQFDIDMETAVRSKIGKDEGRNWVSAQED